MNYRTELMVQILKSDKAQEIIDEVSQIYGDSYVGLWLFQAIGAVLDELSGIIEHLPSEFIPNTANMTLDYWEEEYGLPKDSSLTVEQRQQRFNRKFMDQVPYNPARLEVMVAEVLGLASDKVDIVENSSKNKFTVYVRQSVDDLSEAVKIINQKKPSHLIYDISVAEQVYTDNKVDVALTLNTYEKYEVEVI